jgi:hypothetical protein
MPSCSSVNVLVRVCPDVAYIALGVYDNKRYELYEHRTHNELTERCFTDLVKLVVMRKRTEANHPANSRMLEVEYPRAMASI